MAVKGATVASVHMEHHHARLRACPQYARHRVVLLADLHAGSIDLVVFGAVDVGIMAFHGGAVAFGAPFAGITVLRHDTCCRSNCIRNCTISGPSCRHGRRVWHPGDRCRLPHGSCHVAGRNTLARWRQVLACGTACARLTALGEPRPLQNGDREYASTSSLSSLAREQSIAILVGEHVGINWRAGRSTVELEREVVAVLEALHPACADLAAGYTNAESGRVLIGGAVLFSDDAADCRASFLSLRRNVPTSCEA
jgi:hypothetical protein